VTTRLQISLSKDEASALARWAMSELRDPREQIRFLVRQELSRRGLLPGGGRGGGDGEAMPAVAQQLMIHQEAQRRGLRTQAAEGVSGDERGEEESNEK